MVERELDDALIVDLSRHRCLLLQIRMVQSSRRMGFTWSTLQDSPPSLNLCHTVRGVPVNPEKPAAREGLHGASLARSHLHGVPCFPLKKGPDPDGQIQ